MEFYVIYSFDCPKIRRDYYGRECRNYIADLAPTNKKFRRTETSAYCEYGYLEGDWNRTDIVPSQYPHLHGKYVAFLTKTEFIDFIDEQGIYFEDCETMGSITEFGHLPAFSFTSFGDFIQSAYVTPFPNVEQYGNEETEQRNWERIRKAFSNMFGY